MNWVLEFVCHKQSLDKEKILQATFFQKSIMFGRTEHKLEIKALSMKVTLLVIVFGIDDAVRA